jgi:hypothetical protein
VCALPPAGAAGARWGWRRQRRPGAALADPARARQSPARPGPLQRPRPPRGPQGREGRQRTALPSPTCGGRGAAPPPRDRRGKEGQRRPASGRGRARGRGRGAALAAAVPRRALRRGARAPEKPRAVRRRAIPPPPRAFQTAPPARPAPHPPFPAPPVAAASPPARPAGMSLLARHPGACWGVRERQRGASAPPGRATRPPTRVLRSATTGAASGEPARRSRPHERTLSSAHARRRRPGGRQVRGSRVGAARVPVLHAEPARPQP